MASVVARSITNCERPLSKGTNSKTPIRPNLEDGVKILKVLEAGIGSSESGRRVAVN